MESGQHDSLVAIVKDTYLPLPEFLEFYRDYIPARNCDSDNNFGVPIKGDGEYFLNRAQAERLGEFGGELPMVDVYEYG